LRAGRLCHISSFARSATKGQALLGAVLANFVNISQIDHPHLTTQIQTVLVPTARQEMEFRKQKSGITKSVSPCLDQGVAPSPELSHRSGMSGLRLPRPPKLSGRNRRGGSDVTTALQRTLPSVEISSPERTQKGFAFLRHKRSVRKLKVEDNLPQCPLPQSSEQIPRGEELDEHRMEYIPSGDEEQSTQQPSSTGGYLGVLKDGTIHWVEDTIAAFEDIGSDTKPQEPKEDAKQSITPPAPSKPRRPKIQLRIPHTNYTVFPAPSTNLASRACRMARRRSKSAPQVQLMGSPGKPSPSAVDSSVVSPLSPEDRERRFAPLHSASLSTGAIGARPSPTRPVSPPAPVSASDSSCKTGDHIGGDSNSCFSARSSVSSVDEDPTGNAREKVRESWRSSGVFPNGSFPIIIPPVTCALVDAAPAAPTPPPRAPPKNVPSPDLCKPLPPDPAVNLKPAPLRVSQSRTPYAGPLLKPPRAVSPSSWMVAKRQVPPPLRSKSSASELDRIDYAFLQSSPKRIDDTEAFVAATEALESSIKKELHAISEDMGFESNEPDEQDEPSEPNNSDPSTTDGPLCVSQGPMAAMPTRPAPPPPLQSKGRKVRRLYHSMSNITPNLKPPIPYIRHAASAEWDTPKDDGAGTHSPEIPERSREERGDLPVELEARNARGGPAGGQISRVEKAELPGGGIPQANAGAGVQERVPANSRMPRRAPVASRVLSVTSLAISDITQWYLEMPPPTPADDSEALARRHETIERDAAWTIVLNILMSVDNLRDLFALARANRGFYRTFKRNELRLIKNALWAMSPAAWELREVSPPYGRDEELIMDRPVPEYTPTSYLRNYSRDLYIMVALKSIILDRCQPLLRPETKSALAGEDDERSRKLDDAFWRVWTFCKLFGCNKHREDDIVGQVDWLKGGALANQEEKCSASVSFIQGTADTCVSPTSCLLNPPEAFGKGNGEGLTRSQLSDMMEIWECLCHLLSGFHGQCRTANEFGIFGSLRVDPAIADSKEWLLGKFPNDLLLLLLLPPSPQVPNAATEEWISYLLTLGPSVILDLATPSEQSSQVGFEVAAENGWTRWEAPLSGKSRATFMKQAITKVYEERMAEEGRRRAAERVFSQEVERRRRAKQVAEMRAKRNGSITPPPAAISELPGDSPTSYSPVSFAATTSFSPSSPPIGGRPPNAPLPNATQPPPSPPQYFTAATLTSPKQAKYPLEKAVFQIVGMGFTAAEAKRALAETDTHDRLDVHAAVEVLLRRRKMGRVLGRVELV
ncbi:hypothetical protein FGG08_003750, partial [Glutinoglossum americanum]